MRFNRNEGFRFSFGAPIPAFFIIEEVNGRKVQTSEGEAKLIDLSPSGMKLSTLLDIPISPISNIKVFVRFTLNKTEFHIHGKMVWGLERLGGYLYGIHFSLGEAEQRELIENIKNCAKHPS